MEGEGTQTPVAPATPATPVPAATPPQTPPAAPATPPPAAPFDYTKVVGADGKLDPKWKDGLPEDIRHEMSLNTFDSVPEMAKQYVNAQKMIGKNKVVLPTDKSTPGEIEAFHLALGRPKTVGDYKVEVPQEMKDYFDDGLLGEAKNMAFKMGLNQKQLDGLMEFRKKEIAQGLQQMEQQEQREYEEAERLIVSEAGEALEDQKHFANLLIADNCPNDEYKEKLLSAVNDNKLRPYLFNFLANIQRKYFNQHGGIPAGDGSGTAMTPGMLKSKAEELMATPGYIDGSMRDTNPAGYNRLTTEIAELYNRMDKAAKSASR